MGSIRLPSPHAFHAKIFVVGDMVDHQPLTVILHGQGALDTLPSARLGLVSVR